MRNTLSHLLICIVLCAYALYNYLDNLNDLTRLRLTVPELQQELSLLEIENHELNHAMLKLISPHHLLELKQDAKFNHLRYWRAPKALPKMGKK